VYAALRHSAWHAEVNPFPDMPSQLPTLPQQAWGPLVAVTDACSPAVGDIVRRAAIRPSEEERQQSLDGCIDLLVTSSAGSNPATPTNEIDHFADRCATN
jgi:hypothetical protein